jgi:hypothetical protein
MLESTALTFLSRACAKHCSKSRALLSHSAGRCAANHAESTEPPAVLSPSAVGSRFVSLASSGIQSMYSPRVDLVASGAPVHSFEFVLGIVVDMAVLNDEPTSRT